MRKFQFFLTVKEYKDDNKTIETTEFYTDSNDFVTAFSELKNKVEEIRKEKN